MRRIALFLNIPPGLANGLRRVRDRLRGDHTLQQIIITACQELVRESDAQARRLMVAARKAEKRREPQRGTSR